MKHQEPIIDFSELISAVPGEGLEELTRQLGRRKGLSPSWSGRGSDEGRDLIFTEELSGPLAKEKITWLVSCKDKARSGDSVSERDLPSPGIKDKLAQHKANGFLLVTTTTTSTGAKALLDSLDKGNGGDIHTLVWDSSELTAMLLEPSNHDLVKQFLPNSYQRVKGLTSLEEAVLAFREQIPDTVLAEIMRLVRPYSATPLKGSIVWPYDSRSASVIDQIVRNLLVEQDVNAAVVVTENIEYDAFMAFITALQEHLPNDCYQYLLAVVCQHSEPDIRFNAAQFLFDYYEVEFSDNIRIATHLDDDALKELYESEISSFVQQEIVNNTPDYALYQSIDELSNATQIENIYVSDITFEPDEDIQVNFSGDMTISLSLVFEREIMTRHSFPGEFSGYFNQHGMYLESATIDTRSYYT